MKRQSLKGDTEMNSRYIKKCFPSLTIRKIHTQRLQTSEHGTYQKKTVIFAMNVGIKHPQPLLMEVSIDSISLKGPMDISHKTKN